MLNKINIEIYIPTIDKNYELFIPINKTINDILRLVGKGLNDMLGDNVINFDEGILIDKKTNKIYNNMDIIKNSGLINGSKLIFV